MATRTVHRRRKHHRVRRLIHRTRRWAAYVAYDMRMSRRKRASGHSIL